MLHSHTNPTKINTFAHLKLLIPVNTVKVSKELAKEVTTLPSFSTQRDSKIFLLFQESETLSEFTELHWEFTIIKDNSTQVSSSTVHGLCSHLIKKLLLRKLEKLREVKARIFHINSQENIIVLKSKNQLYCQISEDGVNNISLHKMLSLLICMFPLTKFKLRRETSMS